MSTVTKHVTSYYPRALHGDGGVTNALWLWVESLRQVGVQSEVRYDGRLAPLATRPIHPDVDLRPVHHLGGGRWTLPLGAARKLMPGSILLLHSGYVGFNLVAAAEARRRRVPYVVMPHGAYNPHVRATRRGIRRTWEAAERRMLESAVAVHVFLPVEVGHVEALAPGARCITAPTAFSAPDVTWRQPEGKPYVAWLGRYDVRHKGLDRLLDALARLPAEHRPMLRLHGRDSTDNRRAVQRLVQERGLDEHVVVGPPVDGPEKRELLLGATAFVQASRWESYGIALVEALAHGVPCLTTSDVSLAGHLLEDQAAAVVESSPQALAEGLRAAAAGQLAGYGPRGRRFVRTRLSHRTAGLSLLDQLEQLQLERTRA